MMRPVRIFIMSLIILSFAAIDTHSGDSGDIRIISLAPSTTEILFALGLGDEIVGVSIFCDYPAAAGAIEKVGTFSQPNIEKIFSLKPDIIFCTGLEQAPAIEKLRQLGLKVHVSDPSNFSELFDSMESIGRLTSRDNEAAGLIKRMKEAIEGVRSAAGASARAANRPKIFVEIWHSPLMTAGKGSFLDELITLAGGVNIAYDAPRPYSRFSAEKVIRLDPDLIILAYMDKERSTKSVERRFGWGKISAVKNHRVYDDIDPDLYLRPGPRLVDGLKEIQKKVELVNE